MARCQYRHPSGKRCKAHRMAGSKFCVFHTSGQKMKRRKKKQPVSSRSNEPKSRLRKHLENQALKRGSRGLGKALVARGAYLQSNSSIYTVKYTYRPARYNVQGTRIVGAHTQKTIEMTRTADGRDFVATQTRKNPYAVPHHAYMGNRMVSYGRLIPVLGLGAVMYNTFSGSGPKPREMEGVWQVAALYAVDDLTSHYKSGGTTMDLFVPEGHKTILDPSSWG